MTMLDVLILLKSEKTPSSRIRFREAAGWLRERGVNAVIEFLPEGLLARHRLFRRAADFPVTVLQKRLLSAPSFLYLRHHARCLGFDFDDAIYCRNASPDPDPAAYRSLTRERKFARIVRGVDFVVAANRELAERVRGIRAEVPVSIIPSPVDVSPPPKEEYRLGSPPVLGWVGTRSTLRYLDYLAPALRDLRCRHEFVLRVIADQAPCLSGLEVEFVRWQIDRQEAEIRAFDIGLMPLSADPFAVGKASYKLLQYLALGVPAVASAVGMNREVAGVDEEHCLLAATPGEFAGQCGRLLEDESLRRELGRRGRDRVVAEFSRERVADRLAETLLQAAGRGKGTEAGTLS
jgi:glycosyltransferase involved in cell wall biosynthesis